MNTYRKNVPISSTLFETKTTNHSFKACSKNNFSNNLPYLYRVSHMTLNHQSHNAFEMWLNFLIFLKCVHNFQNIGWSIHSLSTIAIHIWKLESPCICSWYSKYHFYVYVVHFRLQIIGHLEKGRNTSTTTPRCSICSSFIRDVVCTNHLVEYAMSMRSNISGSIEKKEEVAEYYCY